MSALLCALFFASGASSLIFETLWFRQAGLAFGNSVWASSLVLSGFMGGLALGNGVAARHGTRLGNPVRAYAVAETIIAATGIGLVYLLPVLGSALAPLLRPLLDQPLVLNPLRLGAAFLLLLVPSSAMGVTLPLLVRALSVNDRHYGRVLGRLYGWNTLGAVAGVLLAETVLVWRFGVRGTATVASGVGLGAAAVAAWLSTRMIAPASAAGTVAASRMAETRAREQGSRSRWLVAAALCGFCLLALEVVWFRFLVLFVKSHSTAFPLMLAVVLTGIACGSLAASAWLRRVPAASRNAPSLACVVGLACAASYAAFPLIVEPLGPVTITSAPAILRVAIPLMLPVSLGSGALFALLGAAVKRNEDSETQAAGVLALVNTAGAAAGSLTAGFVLLPLLGVERSVFLIAILYGAIGIVMTDRRGAGAPRAGRAPYVTGAALLVALALFPFGTMADRLLPIPVARWAPVESERRVVAVREGLTETVIYFARLFAGKPVSHVMLTNSFSMSTTGYGVRRYQKLYVYWPLAVRPGISSALLIGYGVGNTAKAMTDSPGLKTIDVVDLSRDILTLNRVVYPNEADLPLRDPRVHVHIEDGRYFLQTTDRRFGLITGEPPPPGIAGVESLYTREYFRLLHDRLEDGGIATYWLPLSDLSDVSTKAILGAFCDAFDDCSLWNGAGTNLMLVGTRTAARSGATPSNSPVPEEAFSRQWANPGVADEMKRLALERPEQLGALFIGDAPFIRSLLGGAPSLTDDDPKLIEAPFSSANAGAELLARLTDVSAAKQRFEESPFIRRFWPEGLRMASAPFFDFERVIDAHMYGSLVQSPPAIEDVHRVLTRSSLRTPVLWRLASNDDIQQVVSSATPQELQDPLLQFHRGVRLLSERDYGAAAAAFAIAEQGTDASDNAFALHVYALCMAGETREAEELTKAPFRQSLSAGGVSPDSVRQASLPPFWLWMKETFGIDPRN